MKQKIGLWDLVLMNVIALFGIRWIAKSTADSFGLGLGAIPMWILFAFIFFIPAALICAELAATYPRNGGMYDWVKEAYGEKWGFIVSWLNWTSKLFWFSSFLTFLSINISFALGQPELAQDKLFVLILAIATMWILSFVSMRGMVFGKIFTNIGALGSTIPATLLIIMAFVSVLVYKNTPASVYDIATLTPKLNMDSLSAIASIMFALAGAETTANFVTEVDNPKKTFPKAILLSAVIVSVLYVLGSIAITMILPPDKITASRGILESIALVAAQLGIGPWFIQLIALGIAFSVFGGIVLYMASPIRMLFGSVPQGVFPGFFTKINKYDIPGNALIFQTIVISLLLLGVNLLPSVDSLYNLLVNMTALTALFPYLILFASYIKLRKERPNEERPYSMCADNNTAIAIAKMVLVVSTAGIVLSAAPVMGTTYDNIVYEVQMFGGGLVVIYSAFYIWSRYMKKLKKSATVSN
ncbi:MAG TPA: amino acid permease [Selenomonadales bacterium]|nr:amino acid permease [Selenomonadales bacterium]